MKLFFLLLALLPLACGGRSDALEAHDAHAGWTLNQTMWLPGVNDLTTEPRNPDGSVCFELGTRDAGVAFVAPALGCDFSSECSAMWGGPIEVYTSTPRTEEDVRQVVKIGPCWLFADGVP
jgi:hypothetical protein